MAARSTDCCIVVFSLRCVFLVRALACPAHCLLVAIATATFRLGAASRVPSVALVSLGSLLASLYAPAAFLTWAMALVFPTRFGMVCCFISVPHKPGPICPLSNPHARPVEGGGLNRSPKLPAYTPTSPNPSSTGGLVPEPRLQSPAPGRHRIA